jgi:cysteine synthase A
VTHAWVNEAIRRIDSDFQRSADTHLIHLALPGFAGIDFYLKDESTHPSGSLKHRLARSLFLFGLCNGWIHEGTTVTEASSGSTAVSEAYFARFLGLPFVAVMPRSTSLAKVQQIEFFGGHCHFVDHASEVTGVAARLAAERGGHFMDQFTQAERVTDWRGNNNIAASLFEQLQREPHPVPRWIVVGAGTGGTSATLGRYLRYRGLPSQLCVVDPEHSVFFDHHRTREATLTAARGSGIEGIGRPRVEPSFVPGVIDHMLKVPDAASFAAMRVLAHCTGRRYGPSTGTNLVGALSLAAGMARRGERGSIVLLACDGGERYLDTACSDAWVAQQGLALAPWLAWLEAVCHDGHWPGPALASSSLHPEADPQP